MSVLSEDQVAMLKSVDHYIKYINAKPNVEAWEVWQACLKMEEVGKLMMSENWPPGTTDPYINLEEMKLVVTKMMDNILNFLDKEDKK